MDELIIVTESDKLYIWDHYKINEEKIKEAVKIIKDWMKQQQHLPQIADEELIEKLFIRRKCRIEETKNCVDAYYSVRSIFPAFFTDLHTYIPSISQSSVVVTRKLSSNRELLIILTLNVKPEDYNLLQIVKCVLSAQELALRFDYSLGHKLLLDMTGGTFEHFKRVTPISIIQQFFKIALNAHGNRIMGVYLYNPPTWINLVFDLMKPLMPAKIFGRMSLHKTKESLLKVIEKEQLPIDYGGTNKSMAELIEINDRIFKENAEYLKNIPKIKTHEKMRVGKCKFDTEVFGVEGTFKKINLD